MTGEDVMKGAALMRRWRELHRLRSVINKGDRRLIGVASALVGDPANATIADAAFEAMVAAADAEIERLIQGVHADAKALGISPPFPGAPSGSLGFS